MEEDAEGFYGTVRQDTEVTDGLSSSVDGVWTGMHIVGHPSQFWHIMCPCGVSVTYGLNGLPGYNTRHPCGNPDHWTIRWDDT